MLEKTQIRDFAKALGTHMHGSPLPPAAVDVPFRPLLTLPDGRWRPDGVDLSLKFLSRCVDAYDEDGARKPRFGASGSDIAAATRLLWGLNGYTMSAPAVIHSLSLSHTETTINRWSGYVSEDQAVRSFAERELNVARDAQARWLVPTTPRTSWPWGAGIDAESWPPLSEREHLGDRLAVRFSAKQPIVLNDGSEVTLQALTERLGMRLDELKVRLLRTMLEPNIVQWFSHVEDKKHLIWFRNNVAERWSGRGLFADFLAPVDMPKPSNAKYHGTISTAAQLLAWRLSGNSEEITNAVERLFVARIRIITVTQRITDTVTGQVRFQPAEDVHRVRLTEREENLLARLSHAERSDLWDVPQPGWVKNQRLVTGTLSLALANQIRLESGDAKRQLIGTYLDRRGEAVTGSARDKTALALADHSVGWDIVTLGEHDLARKLTQLVLRDKVPARWSLLSHVYRNFGVLLNKQDKWGQAMRQVIRGLETLDLLSRGELVIDAKERSQAAQQLFLAGAGVAVRRLERGLEQASQKGLDNRLFYTECCRAALWFSRGAMDELSFLDEGDDALARDRAHAQKRGEIANTSWRAQSRVIRFRAMLGVRTALDSGLLTVDDLAAPVSVQGPLLPTEPSGDETYVPEMPDLIESYKDLQRVGELSLASGNDLVPLAVWLGFLNWGRLPVIDEAPGPVFVEHSPLLAAYDSEAGASEVQLAPRLAYVHEWSKRTHQDLRILSWLPYPRGPVSTMLNQRTSGLYKQFRDEHRGYREDYFYSHD